jgi:hypothetical protein
MYKPEGRGLDSQCSWIFNIQNPTSLNIDPQPSDPQPLSEISGNGYQEQENMSLIWDKE